MRSIVALLLLSSISVSVCAGQKDQLKKAAYSKHERMLKLFPCSKPQPRIFELEDVIDKDTMKYLNDKNERRSIRPAVTVLQRCQSTGCCKNSQERCMAIKAEEVTLTFRIAAARMRYLEVKAENHIECACMGPNDSYIK